MSMRMTAECSQRENCQARGAILAEKTLVTAPNLAISRHGKFAAQPINSTFPGLPCSRHPSLVTRPWSHCFSMSRFVNLEFEGDSNHDFEPGGKVPVKDEAYYMAEARRAFENGSFEPGLRYYSKVLEFNPKNAAAWTGQVRMLIELGEFREAKLWADKALERFPNEPELLAAKAVALARSGDLQGALSFSDTSIEERGDTPYVWLARGDVLLARAEARADYCFEKALLLAPHDWFIAWLAARVRCYYEQFVLALKHLQRAVELNPGHFLLWLEQGRCQQALGLTGAAGHSFNQARQLNKDCLEANQALVSLSQTSLFAQLRGRMRGFFKR